MGRGGGRGVLQGRRRRPRRGAAVLRREAEALEVLLHHQGPLEALDEAPGRRQVLVGIEDVLKAAQQGMGATVSMHMFTGSRSECEHSPSGICTSSERNLALQ